MANSFYTLTYIAPYKENYNAKKRYRRIKVFKMFDILKVIGITKKSIDVKLKFYTAIATVLYVMPYENLEVDVLST